MPSAKWKGTNQRFLNNSRRQQECGEGESRGWLELEQQDPGQRSGDDCYHVLFMCWVLCVFESHLVVRMSFTGKNRSIPILRRENWRSEKRSITQLVFGGPGCDPGLSKGKGHSAPFQDAFLSYLRCGKKTTGSHEMYAHVHTHVYVYNFCCLLKNSGKKQREKLSAGEWATTTPQSLRISFMNSLLHLIITRTFLGLALESAGDRGSCPHN